MAMKTNFLSIKLNLEDYTKLGPGGTTSSEYPEVIYSLNAGTTVHAIGSLEAQSSSMSGLGAGGGSLLSQAAQVDGTGSKVITDSLTDLQAQSSIVVGSGTRSSDSTGDLISQNTTWSSKAGVFEAQDTWFNGEWWLKPWFGGEWFAPSTETSFGAGVLTSQVAVVSCTAERIITATSSDLLSPNGIVTGIGEIISVSTGDLLSQQPVIVGTAERIITSSAINLFAQSSTILGTAENTVSGLGTLSIQSSVISGIGERSINSVSTDLLSQDSIVTAIAEREVTGSGNISSLASEVNGVGSITVDTSADLQAQSSIVSGIGYREIEAAPTSLISQSSTVVGVAENAHLGSGVLTSQEASVVGEGVTGALSIGSGNLLSQIATIIGGEVKTVTGSGTIISESPLIIGTGYIFVEASGAITAQSAIISGYGLVDHASQNYEIVEFGLKISRSNY